MWTCSLLKQNAKAALRGRYWIGFLVCFVLGLLGVSGGAPITLTLNLGGGRMLLGTTGQEPWPGARTTALAAPTAYRHGAMPYMAFLGALSLFLFVVLAIVVCWEAFLAAPLSVGMARYFMESRQARAPFGTAFSVFDAGYLNIVKVMFLTNLKILLGSLIIVPGIYWAYCYRLVPYLLAENPYMTRRRAMELSKQMMYGEKWHSFVLELSFLGWDLLAVLTCGIGALFLTPYMQATFAELYAALRSKAFAYGLSDTDELAGFVTHGEPT